MAELDELERRVGRLEDCYNVVARDIAEIKGSQRTVETLVKWVILPLIGVVGALVGIKLANPGA